MKYLIIDVAGKHFSTTDATIANTIVINEIQAINQNNNKIKLTPLDYTQTGGNFPLSSYWNNGTILSYKFMVNGSLMYSLLASSSIIGVYNTTADTSMFRRFVMQADINDVNEIKNLSVFLGGNKQANYLLPKQISAYICDSYDVNTNLTNRSNVNLTQIGTTIDIPNTTINITEFSILGGNIERSFLIFDIAGKWYDINDSSYSNNIVVNELEVLDVSGQNASVIVLDKTQIGVKKFTIYANWDNVDVMYNKTRLIDLNKGYATTAALVTNTLSTKETTDSYTRFVMSISKADTVSVVKAYFGGIDYAKYKLPKQISVYKCDSYDVTNNLVNRSDEGLTFLGKADIPNNIAMDIVGVPIYIAQQNYYSYLI